MIKNGDTPHAFHSLLEAALWYAGRGFRVFPLYSIKDGKCLCKKRECASPGKHPLTRDGNKSATTDRKQIMSWWKQYPTANIGIATGKDSKILVIDLDVHGAINGEENLVKMAIKLNESIPITCWQRTGSGGKHLIFEYPENSGISIRKGGLTIGDEKYEGIDIRGEGGYIVAAPSNHISGGNYEFYDIPILQLPKWILKVLLGQDEDKKWILTDMGNGEFESKDPYDIELPKTPLSIKEIEALTNLLENEWHTEKDEDEVDHRTIVQALSVVCRRRLVDEKSLMEFILKFNTTHKHKDGKIHPPGDIRTIVRDHYARLYKIPKEADMHYVMSMYTVIADRHIIDITISEMDHVYGLVRNGTDGKVEHIKYKVNRDGEEYAVRNTIIRFAGIIGPVVKIDGATPGLKVSVYGETNVWDINDAISFFHARYSLTPTLTQAMREIIETYVHSQISSGNAVEYASSPVTVINDIITVTPHNTDIKKSLISVQQFLPYASHPTALICSMAWAIAAPLHDYLKVGSTKGILTPILLMTGKTRAGKSSLGNLWIGKGMNQTQKQYFYPYERIRTKFTMMKHLAETNIPAVFDDISTTWINDNKEGIKAYLATGIFGDRGRSDQTMTTYRGRRSFMITINDEYSIDTDLALSMRMILLRFTENETKRQNRTKYNELFDSLQTGFIYDIILDMFGGKKISDILSDIEKFTTSGEWINYVIDKLNEMCTKYGVALFPRYSSMDDNSPPEEARLVCEFILEQWNRIKSIDTEGKTPYPEVSVGEVDVDKLDDTYIVWFTAGVYKRLAKRLDLTHKKVSDFFNNFPTNDETAIYKVNVSHKFVGLSSKAYAISYNINDMTRLL